VVYLVGEAWVVNISHTNLKKRDPEHDTVDPKQCTKVEDSFVSRRQCIAVKCEVSASRIVFGIISGWKVIFMLQPY